MVAQVSEARQQIVDLALQVGFEDDDKDDVEDLLLSHREELNNEDLLSRKEKRIREGSESSPEEVVPGHQHVRARTYGPARMATHVRARTYGPALVYL